MKRVAATGVEQNWRGWIRRGERMKSLCVICGKNYDGTTKYGVCQQCEVGVDCQFSDKGLFGRVPRSRASEIEIYVYIYKSITEKLNYMQQLLRSRIVSYLKEHCKECVKKPNCWRDFEFFAWDGGKCLNKDSNRA